MSAKNRGTTIKNMLDTLKEYSKELLEQPTCGARFLKETGIYTKTGRLTKMYK